jgi:ATPase subunit of ABC transporter with duplicated ATPase domains
MPLLSVQGLALCTPTGRVLIESASFSLPPGITALVGANGVGKSSLLRVLAGEAPPAAGRVHRHGCWRRLGDAPLDTAALAALARLAPRCHTLAEPLRTLWPRPGPDPGTAARSGGEQQRLRLLAALATPADGLLLDEPAAQLDAEARAALCRWLATTRPTCLLVAHDPELLALADGVLELSGRALHAYRMDFASYRRQREAEQREAAATVARLRREAQQERALAQQARERAERRAAGGQRLRRRGSQGAMLLDYRAGRADASRAWQTREAQRRESAIAALQAAGRERLCLTAPLRLSLAGADLAAGQRVVEARGLGLDAADGRLLFRDLDLVLQGPQRLWVCGRNGSGKSRLLRVLAGVEAPARGQLRRHLDDQLLIDQEAALAPAAHPLAAVLAAQPGLDEGAAREHLAGFLFAGELATAPLPGLSSGERLRLRLACALAGRRPPRLLLLDEPDNHLDLPSRAVLAAALRDYRGAVVLATHSPSLPQELGMSARLCLGAPAPQVERL